MIQLFITVFLSFSAGAIDYSGTDFEGYIDVRDEILWVEYKAPAHGEALVVLLNGLTYSTDQWKAFDEALQTKNPNLGILKYDMRGQGKTLASIPDSKALYREYSVVAQKYMAIHDYRNPVEYYAKLVSGEIALDTFEYFESVNRLWGLMLEMNSLEAQVDIHYSEQSKDLHSLLQMFRGMAKVHITGLSYGGAIAMQYLAEHPNNLESATLMAPFVERLAQQDIWITTQIQIARAFNPYLHLIPDSELYDFFLRILVFSTYPQAEPIILENPLKLEAVFRLAKGSKDFNGFDILNSLPSRKVHLMVAMQDEYVDRAVLDKLWDGMGESGASRVYIEGTKHKIPEVTPNFSAEWVSRIANEDPVLQNGDTFHLEAHIAQ